MVETPKGVQSKLSVSSKENKGIPVWEATVGPEQVLEDTEAGVKDSESNMQGQVRDCKVWEVTPEKLKELAWGWGRAGA